MGHMVFVDRAELIQNENSEVIPINRNYHIKKYIPI